MNIDLCEIRLLIRFATQRTGRPIHDEDLVQDATLKAVEAFRKQFEIRYPRAFLRKIVGDTVRDHWRRRRAQEDLATIDEENLSESPCFEENLDLQRRIDWLRRGLAQLDEGKRATLVLFYVEEHSVSEIARLQRKSMSAVKMELLRARRQLARIVGDLARALPACPSVMAKRAFMVLSPIMKTALSLVMLVQLVAPNLTLPQVMSARFSTDTPIKAGQKANVTVTLNVMKGYKINREPTVSLTVAPVAGVNVATTSIDASPVDKKSTDEYYVDLPRMTIGLTATKAGKYELPGKFTYFFCSKADGFCAKQVLDVKIPLQVE